MYREVEQIVGEYFGIDPEVIRNGKRLAREGRRFTWYLLHYALGYKASAIAREYGVTKRNILYAVLTIKDNVQVQPQYARHLLSLQAILCEKGILD